MDVILASVEWQHAISYIDETIIFSKTPEQHLQHIEEVLRLLKKVAQKTTQANESLQYPPTLSTLRSVLGLCEVHCELVTNLARPAFSSNKKLKK